MKSLCLVNVKDKDMKKFTGQSIPVEFLPFQLSESKSATVCFPALQAPSKKGFTLDGKLHSKVEQSIVEPHWLEHLWTMKICSRYG